MRIRFLSVRRRRSCCAFGRPRERRATAAAEPVTVLAQDSTNAVWVIGIRPHHYSARNAPVLACIVASQGAPEPSPASPDNVEVVPAAGEGERFWLRTNPILTPPCCAGPLTMRINW